MLENFLLSLDDNLEELPIVHLVVENKEETVSTLVPQSLSDTHSSGSDHEERDNEFEDSRHDIDMLDLMENDGNSCMSYV